MAEYIKKQVAIDALHEAYEARNPTQNAIMDKATMVIFRLPPADVRPVVRGRWVETSYDFWDCSVCGETLRMETDGICNFDKDPKFCPNCGSYNGGDADG